MLLNYLRIRKLAKARPVLCLYNRNQQSETQASSSGERESNKINAEKYGRHSTSYLAKDNVHFKEALDVRPFDELPGPKILKYLALGRQYFSNIGIELTARTLIAAYNIGTVFKVDDSHRHLKYLFDEHGPMVRFISPFGGDIVLTNNSKHISEVFAQEGQFPVRSTLDSLQKYRRRKNSGIMSPFYGQNDEWVLKKSSVSMPLQSALERYSEELWSSCQCLADRIAIMRNIQDEFTTDLYQELHKWAFDCMGHIILSKRMATLSRDLEYKLSDAMFLYEAFSLTTDALMRCESGLQFWRLFETPAFKSLVANCENLENLIGKHVYAVEQNSEVISDLGDDPVMSDDPSSLIVAMLKEENVLMEDVITIIMDMLLIGVNTTASATSFLLYNLARSPKHQKHILKELEESNIDIKDINSLKKLNYLQACIKETLRLHPPIPLLTRILPKTIVLDRFSIPRGTLIIMSTQDSSLKESNFDDSKRFSPDRWLNVDSKDLDGFASIPFGFGVRKCLGQGIAEAAMSMLAIKLLQRYKLEYHYGDITQTSTFIIRPDKPLRIRFHDRHIE